jgi:type I restriction enzyme S subunit
MNTKQLRQKILDLAIRGKLVPQNPNDEPASVLLERIRAEKEKLRKEGKIKRNKKDLAINGADKLHYENVPFELPEGWEWANLDQISKNISAGGDRPIIYEPEKTEECFIPIYSNGLAENGLYGYTNKATIPEPSVTVSARGTIGYSFVRYEPFCPIIRLISITPNIEVITLEYLQKALSYLIPTGDGSSIPQLTVPAIKPKMLPLPPLAEQQRIVSAIEATFSTIDEIERNKTDLQSAVTAAKQKILSLAIHGKLVPQDPNDEPASVLLDRIRTEREALIKAGKIKRSKSDSAAIVSDDNSPYGNLPEGWEVCHLSNIGQIIGGGTPNTGESSYWDGGNIAWITPADLSGYNEKYIVAGSRMITTKGLAQSSAVLIPAGSILFSSRAPIGYCVIAKNDVCTNQGFKSVSPYITGMSEYIYYYLKAQVEEIRIRASGTTFKEISGTEFGNTTITLPPLTEQQRIVAAIELAFNQLDKIFDNLM